MITVVVSETECYVRKHPPVTLALTLILTLTLTLPSGSLGQLPTPSRHHTGSILQPMQKLEEGAGLLGLDFGVRLGPAVRAGAGQGTKEGQEGQLRLGPAVSSNSNWVLAY